MKFGLHSLGNGPGPESHTVAAVLLFAVQISLLLTCSSEHLLPDCFFLPFCHISAMVLTNASP